MNDTVLRLRSINFSGHRGAALEMLEDVTLARHPLTREEYFADMSEMDYRACPICLSALRVAECMNGGCVCHILPAGAEGA